ncbi:MAG: nuclear transport factor 2 family protein [Chloroflexi bacterium]|nr:nuclear transport factor 2 family protein [Chloroflexota bacterium]
MTDPDATSPEAARLEAEVIAANTAFYEAFAKRDVPAMEELWASEAPIACTHPAWPVLIGRRDVLRSWRGILENPDAPSIEPRDAVVHPAGDAAIVLCREIVNDTPLEVTNVFVRERGEWRIAHHHASAVAPSVRERFTGGGATSGLGGRN